MLKKWTKEEIEILKKNYATVFVRDLLNLLKGRSKKAITRQAERVGVKKVSFSGKSSPVWNQVEKSCQHCGKIYFIKQSHSENSRFCSTNCLHEGGNYSRGENHYHWGNGENIRGNKNGRWRGGKSFEPYPITFNEPFKRMIRERDNYTCAICKEYGKEVHHINYVKIDTTPENCITLCKSCHGKTNSNRDYWIKYFRERNQVKT